MNDDFGFLMWAWSEVKASAHHRFLGRKPDGTSARQTSTSVTESGDACRSPKPAAIFKLTSSEILASLAHP
jgi:hypothetical protein